MYNNQRDSPTVIIPNQAHLRTLPRNSSKNINKIEYYNKKRGFICAGTTYNYAREAFGEDASYLKLGMVNPLPHNLIKDFAEKVDRLVVIEELDGIIEAIENEEIEISEAGNWINGSYPEGSDDALRKAADDALVAIEAYTCVADIDAVFDNIKAAIASFWASKINGVKSLPFRVGRAEDGLPGAFES